MIHAYSFVGLSPKYKTRVRRKIKEVNIDPHLIINLVSEVLKQPIEQITGRSRKHIYVQPRQIATHLIRNNSTMREVDIAKLFGYNDHSTVSYSIKTVDGLLDVDRKFKKKYDEIKNKL